MTDALILAGGIAKGAFAAGVLSVLLGPEGKGARVDVHSIVGASSGALNGAFAAAVLHAGTEAAKIERLASLWLDEATFGHVFEPTLAGILGGKGVSGEDKVRDILRNAITPAPPVRTIELRLVVANLAGSAESMGGSPATTFEQVFLFDGATFASANALETMFRTVTASAAFPGAFVPVPLEIDGRTVPCVDGGAVNNTPLGYALQHPFGVDRVFVVSPQPRVLDEAPSQMSGLGLVTHLAEMLVEERLYRDLRGAYATNEALVKLAALLPDEAVLSKVLETIGWGGRTPIEIIELRPAARLAGEMFDGFFSRDLRVGYVESGAATARAWVTSEVARLADQGRAK